MAGYIGTKAVALSTTTGNILGDMTVGGTTDVGTLEFNSLSGTGSVTITDILDEDNLASNSATKLATQQSIKAYVDAQVDTVDTLAEILAVGNRTSGTGKIEFRDAAIFINSSADGQLDLVADTEIQIAATTVDINGAVDMSSTLALGGDLTTAADANIIVQGTHNEGGALLDLKGTDTPAASKNLGSLSFGNSTDRSLAMIRSVSEASDAADLRFYTEATGAAIEERMRISSTGATTFNKKIIVSAADGVADADYVADFRNLEATGARSFGVNIQAGSTSSDVALNINDHDASNSLFQVKGNGAVVVGNTLTLSDGELSFANGHGIDFSATSGPTNGSNSSEILDDYEEGLWTPVLTGCDGVTFSGNLRGRYTKIGALVHVQWYSGNFTVANAVSGAARITSLPFVPTGTSYASASFAHTTAFTNNAVQGFTNGSNTHIYVSMEGSTQGNTWSNGNPRYVMMSCVYLTNVF